MNAPPENPFNIKVSPFDPEGEIKPKLLHKLAPAEAQAASFAQKNRKYSMNENDFSSDILTKVNDDNGINRDISPDR